MELIIMMFRRRAKWTSILTLVSVLVALLGILVACGKQETPSPTSVALVVGDRSNTAVPTPESLIKVVPKDLIPGAVVAAIQVDGSADGVTLYNEKVPREKKDFDQKKVPTRVIAELRSGLEKAMPAKPEANTLGAIGSASRALRDASGAKKLIVADSMLSTAGLLQFQTGLLDSTPEDVVASLDKEELPDLRDVDVDIYGAGEVRDPQDALTESKRKRLEEIWDRLLKQAGAKSVTFHGPLGENKEISGYPPVTVIAISQPIAVVAKPDTCSHVLSEQLIQFVPDTADFVDPAAARLTITSVAESMRGCSGTVTVTGTTSSWGDAAGRQKVSQDRAETVRRELAAAMGIDASEIVARGVGMDFPEYINDRDPSGRLIPAEAAKNRSVRISEM